MDLSELHNEAKIASNYDLNEEQENKEIVRQYRALLRAIREKLKKGDKELLRTAFEMATKRIKPCDVKVASLIYYTLLRWP